MIDRTTFQFIFSLILAGGLLFSGAGCGVFPEEYSERLENQEVHCGSRTGKVRIRITDPAGSDEKGKEPVRKYAILLSHSPANFFWGQASLGGGGGMQYLKIKRGLLEEGYRIAEARYMVPSEIPSQPLIPFLQRVEVREGLADYLQTEEKSKGSTRTITNSSPPGGPGAPNSSPSKVGEIVHGYYALCKDQGYQAAVRHNFELYDLLLENLKQGQWEESEESPDPPVVGDDFELVILGHSLGGIQAQLIAFGEPVAVIQRPVKKKKKADDAPPQNPAPPQNSAGPSVRKIRRVGITGVIGGNSVAGFQAGWKLLESGTVAQIQGIDPSAPPDGMGWPAFIALFSGSVVSNPQEYLNGTFNFESLPKHDRKDVLLGLFEGADPNGIAGGLPKQAEYISQKRGNAPTFLQLYKAPGCGHGLFIKKFPCPEAETAVDEIVDFLKGAWDDKVPAAASSN